MSNLPKISTYGQYSNQNYGMHCLCVTIGPVTLYYSYSTLVSFSVPGYSCVRENIWKTTTGRHLNCIDGGGQNKKKRLSLEEFERAYQKYVVEQYNLV